MRTLNCTHAVNAGHPCRKDIKLLGKCNECKEHEGCIYAHSVFRDQKPAAMRNPPLLCYMRYNAGLPTLSHRPMSSASVPNNALRWGIPTQVSATTAKTGQYIKCYAKSQLLPPWPSARRLANIVHAPTASTDPHDSLTL